MPLLEVYIYNNDVNNQLKISPLLTPSLSILAFVAQQWLQRAMFLQT